MTGSVERSSSGMWMSRGRRKKIIRAELPDVILRNDVHPGDIGDPEIVVAQAEARANSRRTKSFASNRARAAELHREADQLYFKGDYESALVLYHRASRLFPRETIHAVAARRAEVAISSTAADPQMKINPGIVKMMRDARNPGQLGALVCPETAAKRARDILHESKNPEEDVPRILRYFDKRKDFWRLSSPTSSTPRSRNTQSRPMQRQLNHCVSSTVKDVENASNIGDSEAVRKLSLELVSLVTLTEEPKRNQVDAYAYLVDKQLECNRHDRAIDLASRMLFLARTNADLVAIVKALVTIGKVHLKFGHLDALVKVWERLVADLQMEPTAQACLYHDIGRCHLELGSDHRALQSAKSCLKQAELGKSSKWTLRGQLLSGQSLLKIGRLPEAVSSLKLAAKIAAELGDDERSILLYVQNLIDQVTCLLRQLNREIESRKPSSNEISGELLDCDIEDPVVLTNRESLEKNSSFVPATTITVENQVVSDEPSDPIIKSLLEKTLALRPNNDKSFKVPVITTTPILSADSTDVDEDKEHMDDDEGKDGENVSTMNTSRTRIIRKCRGGGEQRNSDDERNFNDLCLVEQLDFKSLSFVDGHEDVVEGESASRKIDSPRVSVASSDAQVNDDNISTVNDVSYVKEFKSYFFEDDELTTRSFSYNLENEMEPVEMSSRSVQETGLSDYLKTLEPQDFEEFLTQEKRFFASRTNIDRSFSYTQLEY